MKENGEKQLAEAIELAAQMTKDSRREKEISEALRVADGLEKDKDVPKANDKLAFGQDADTFLSEQELFIDKKAIRAEKTRKYHVKRILICICTISIVAAACLVTAFSVIKLHGRAKLRNLSENNNPKLEGQGISYEEDIVYHNGKRYIYNESIITILVMGIDDKGDSDANILVVIKPEDKQIVCVNINRDSISAVKVYSPAGDYITTSDMQIALSYAYGTSEEESCELMRETVSDMMYRLPIHGYISVNMTKISDINDVVGGVTLKCLETLDEDIVEGSEVKLDGELALKYVTERDSHSGEIGTNSARLERQSQYIYEWYRQLMKQIDNKPSKILEIYNEMKADIATNLDFDEITYLADVISDCSMQEKDIYSVPGEYERSNYYDEYIIDEDALVDMILDIFYSVEN